MQEEEKACNLRLRDIPCAVAVVLLCQGGRPAKVSAAHVCGLHTCLKRAKFAAKHLRRQKTKITDMHISYSCWRQGWAPPALELHSGGGRQSSRDHCPASRPALRAVRQMCFNRAILTSSGSPLQMPRPPAQPGHFNGRPRG